MDDSEYPKLGNQVGSAHALYKLGDMFVDATIQVYDSTSEGGLTSLHFTSHKGNGFVLNELIHLQKVDTIDAEGCQDFIAFRISSLYRESRHFYVSLISTQNHCSRTITKRQV